jgi:hypothetical protein
MYVLAHGQKSWANRRPRLFTVPAVAGAVSEQLADPLDFAVQASNCLF